MRAVRNIGDRPAMQKRNISAAVAFLGVACVATLILFPEAAHAAALAEAKLRLAYIDPGSGSFILQALIAAVAGAAVAVNAYWGKIKGILGIGTPKPEDESANRELDDG